MLVQSVVPKETDPSGAVVYNVRVWLVFARTTDSPETN
jgi:hypothetical protein